MKKILTIFAILLSGNASAAEIYECSTKTQGMLQCIEGKQCECKNFRPSTMRDDAGGYRWDCSILRAPCIDLNKISDRENAKPYDGPDSVYIENK